MRTVRLALTASALALLLIGAEAGAFASGAAHVAHTGRAAPAAVFAGSDWPMFGFGPQRSNDSEYATGVDPAHLFRVQVTLPGTVDSSPIYLHGVSVGGATRNVFIVTTTYGKTLAINAQAPHQILWTYTPPGFSNWDGSAQITTASPAADPDRAYIYAASPDGLIHKLRVSNGSEVVSGDWPIAVTRAPATEKIASALNVFGGYVFVSTGGYIGDAPPYIGHVSVIVASTGQRLHTFDSLCASLHMLVAPAACPNSGSAIWARSGVVVDRFTGVLFAATGNGLYDGRNNFGDSVLELTQLAARLLHHYTPLDYATLDQDDLDLGSTAPALLVAPGHHTPGYLVQGGKDGLLRLVNMASMGLGSAVQEVPAPGGGELLTAIAVRWRLGHEWVYVADDQGTACWAFTGSTPRLHLVWHNTNPGTSPVLAGGLLYVFDPNGGLRIYRPESGQRIQTLPTGSGHWQSPVVAGGEIAIAEGDANDHADSGVLDLFGP